MNIFEDVAADMALKEVAPKRFWANRGSEVRTPAGRGQKR